jgi:hypothetical protein
MVYKTVFARCPNCNHLNEFRTTPYPPQVNCYGDQKPEEFKYIGYLYDNFNQKKCHYCGALGVLAFADYESTGFFYTLNENPTLKWQEYHNAIVFKFGELIGMTPEKIKMVFKPRLVSTTNPQCL